MREESGNHNNNYHSSAKLIPIQAKTNSNENEVNIIKDKRGNIKPNFLREVVRKSNSRETFHKGDITILSNDIFTITKQVDDTIQSCYLESFFER